jgi:amino acid adenylation domain-containing protein
MNDATTATIYSIFAHQADTLPNQPAVIHNELRFTYGQIKSHANSIAAYFTPFVQDEAFIAISTSRTAYQALGIIAIFQLGKSYIPLDPTFPKDRLTQIIEDSGVQFVLCLASERSFFESLGLKVSTYEDVVALPETDYLTPNPAPQTGYALYTSGSTGQPKGVKVNNDSLVNLIQWQAKDSIAGVGFRTLQFAPLLFDVSFQEFFSTLSTGGTLYMIDEELRLNPIALLQFIDDNQINRLFLPFVALQLLTDTAEFSKKYPSSLKEVMTAGEQLKITPQVVRFFQEIKNAVLYNQYGPTEASVIVTCLKLTGDPTAWPTLPSIGKPIAQVDMLILNEKLEEVPLGETGEIHISGRCLAEGYLNRPDLTEKQFFNIHLPTKGNVRVYKSGDLGFYNSEGNIELLGRIDHQVKIRGHRLELGEIESLLIQQDSVRDAVVLAVGDHSESKRLVAYLLMNTEAAAFDAMEIQRSLRQNLPDYMVPTSYVRMDSFPYSKSGKVDRKILPIPIVSRPDLDTPYRAPIIPSQNQVASAWKELLEMDKIGLDDNFFELGGNSLLAQKTIVYLYQHYGIQLPITKLYQYPTVAGIADFIDGGTEKLQFRKIQQDQNTLDDPIAIIGMAGRFPGASDINALWDVLIEGKETTHFFTREELDPSLPSELINDPNYVAARGIIDQAEYFDEQLFGMTPIMAKLMDPQQRIFMEICREVLEQTGHLPANYDGHVGIFGGSGNNTYYLQHVLTNPDEVAKIGAFNALTLNEKDYLTSRASYHLNLKGPAVSVLSACSTSSLAIAQAVVALRTGQCDVAIAGGVAINTPIHSGQRYEEGAMFSVDGHCRPFDKEATGTVFSDGAGVIALKKLSQAIADGDEIYALIKGIGVNNDGGEKGSFTAPSAQGQAQAIVMALNEASIDPSEITYIEAHGTATPLGDPIEFEGLKLAFGHQEQKQFCRIGSIKSNMGHLTHAAGVAGIIKTALAMKHGVLPPSLHYNEANPNIDFTNSPFRVNAELSKWDEPKRIAGISSFGVGGTNVHVVLENFQSPSKPSSNKDEHVQLIAWSAKSKSAAEAYAEQLEKFISRNPTHSLSHIGFSLRVSRPDYAYRSMLVATDPQDLQNKLKQKLFSTHHVKINNSPVVFMFPGQGAQYVRMGHSIYQKEPIFKAAVDRCSEILAPILGEDLRDILYADPKQEQAANTLRNTKYTQPALFVTQYALSQLWMHWGLTPSAFIGHSVGEFVAAHLAGVFSLEDALKLVANRGKLISELPGGSMLSVRQTSAWIDQHLPSTLSLAAINAPELCVVAGKSEDIQQFAEFCESKEVRTGVLHTSHAFHSFMMDPILPQFAEIVKSCTFHVPQRPIASTVTGQWLKDQEATNPDYWVSHVKATVRFSTAIAFCHQAMNGLYLEVGPGTVTATLARQHQEIDRNHILSGIQPDKETGNEWPSLIEAAGKLWQKGIQIQWETFYKRTRQEFLRDLPPYAYQKTKHWLQVTHVQPVMPLTLPTNQLQHPPITIQQPTEMRKDILIRKVKEILDEASGIQIDDQDVKANFIEIGLDSLLLTQIAQTLKKEFALPITFRKLNEEYNSLDLLADYLDTNLPAEQFQPTPSTTVTATVANPPQHPAAYQAPVSVGIPMPAPMPMGANQDTITLISQQISLISQQIALLNGSATSTYAQPTTVIQPQVHHGTSPTTSPVTQVSSATASPKLSLTEGLSKEELTELKKPFGATARIEKQATDITQEQKEYVKNFIASYVAKTKKSKDYTQEHRAYMADPRVVSGFKPATKEMTYALVVNKSAGCRLWDIDGNEYIDALNGFGSSMLGNQPEVVKKALIQQIEEGYEIGPQHEKAGQVCKLVQELTGQDRVGLCNTGSEAVLGAMRIARTVTGRSLIVAFANSYHGIVDEVIVRGTKKLKTFPAASGIMPEAVQNMLILDYGTDESLAIIRERADELAAVLVEPIQSRRPEFAPIEFLKEVREITKKSGTALIFDEVISGFRFHQAGAQGLFGIKADIGTYGKVAGAGISIGIIAGQKEFMDSLDGGFWQYGDDSVPEVGVTYFAGTFVRHPLALATTLASLQYMKEQGPSLQANLNNNVTYLADQMNAIAQKHQTPIYIAHYGSLWKIKYHEEFQFSELIFAAMRLRGIHILDGFPCFLTTAHTKTDIDAIWKAFEESIIELKKVGFIPVFRNQSALSTTAHQQKPPVEGARLGKDHAGNPAWFVEDPAQPGKYLQVESN